MEIGGTHVERIVRIVRRLRHQNHVLVPAGAVLKEVARNVLVLGREVVLVGHEGCRSGMSAKFKFSETAMPCGGAAWRARQKQKECGERQPRIDERGAYPCQERLPSFCTPGFQTAWWATLSGEGNKPRDKRERKKGRDLQNSSRTTRGSAEGPAIYVETKPGGRRNHGFTRVPGGPRDKK